MTCFDCTSALVLKKLLQNKNTANSSQFSLNQLDSASKPKPHLSYFSLWGHMPKMC